MSTRNIWSALLTVVPLCAGPVVVAQETLLDAARQGAVEKVRQFLGTGANIEGKSRDGDTALILAAREGHNLVVELLLAASASMDAANSAGDTAMLVASARGHLRVVELFLTRDVRLSTANKAGDTALILAVQHSRADVAKQLIRKIHDVAVLNAKNKEGRTALHWAIRNGDIELEKLLRAQGAFDSHDAPHASSDGGNHES